MVIGLEEKSTENFSLTSLKPRFPLQILEVHNLKSKHILVNESGSGVLRFQLISSDIPYPLFLLSPFEKVQVH